MLLETGEDLADLFGFAEVGDGVGNAVAVFEPEERGEFFLATYIVREPDAGAESIPNFEGRGETFSELCES